jgi:putative oxidoreductase
MFEVFTKNTLVPLLLRAGLAVIFLYHGLHKVNEHTDWGLGWNPNLPGWQQALVAWGELLGGVALAVGFLTRPAALGLVAIMAGAIATVHWQYGFGLITGLPSGPGEPPKLGYEYNFALLVMLAAVFLLGPGTLSVDRMLRKARAAASAT